jgi:hypothetical protein
MSLKKPQLLATGALFIGSVDATSVYKHFSTPFCIWRCLFGAVDLE